MTRNPRGGFALLAVLWVLVGLSALGLAIALVGRSGVRAAANRGNLARARWTADGCIARSRAAIAEALSAWSELDRLESLVPLVPVGGDGCVVTLRPAGLTLDVNAADGAMLRALLARIRIPEARADSLADALQDWRDGDDVPRPHGAERDAYARAGRVPPRNGPLADVRELALVRGYRSVPGLDSLFGIEPGRLLLDRAPLPVLGALPGIGDEALARLAELRARGVRVGDLTSFAGQLSPPARRALLAHYAELARSTAAEPDAWTLTARAQSGTPPVTAVIALRLVRAGDRAAIVRRREWIE